MSLLCAVNVWPSAVAGATATRSLQRPAIAAPVRPGTRGSYQISSMQQAHKARGSTLAASAQPASSSKSHGMSGARHVGVPIGERELIGDGAPGRRLPPARVALPHDRVAARLADRGADLRVRAGGAEQRDRAGVMRDGTPAQAVSVDSSSA